MEMLPTSLDLPKLAKDIFMIIPLDVNTPIINHAPASLHKYEIMLSSCRDISHRDTSSALLNKHFISPKRWNENMSPARPHPRNILQSYVKYLDPITADMHRS